MAEEETLDSLKKKLQEMTSLKRKLQEIFKCPVCLAVPREGPVIQCSEGHAMCNGKSFVTSLFGYLDQIC